VGDDLRRRFSHPWQLGEKLAEEAFGWIVEDTVPSAIPTTWAGIAELVDRITPMAMGRASELIRQALAGPVAFPRDMFTAIEEGFRLRLTQLLIQRAEEA
jgi:hypothetical protein